MVKWRPPSATAPPFDRRDRRFADEAWRTIRCGGCWAPAAGGQEIRSRFGRYFRVASQQHSGSRLAAYHLVRDGA